MGNPKSCLRLSSNNNRWRHFLPFHQRPAPKSLSQLESGAGDADSVYGVDNEHLSLAYTDVSEFEQSPIDSIYNDGDEFQDSFTDDSEYYASTYRGPSEVDSIVYSEAGDDDHFKIENSNL